MTKNITPTDWHRRPKGFQGQPCPICGWPTPKGEHRTVAPEENMTAKWLRREKSPTGWKMFPVFEPKPNDAALLRKIERIKTKSSEVTQRLLQGNRELEKQAAPSPKVAERMGKVAVLIAHCTWQDSSRGHGGPWSDQRGHRPLANAMAGSMGNHSRPRR